MRQDIHSVHQLKILINHLLESLGLDIERSLFAHIRFNRLGSFHIPIGLGLFDSLRGIISLYR